MLLLLTAVLLAAWLHWQRSGDEPVFMQMYREYNIVDANADPDNQKILTVSFNQIVITGFLIKVMIGRYNQDGIDGHRFSLHMLGFTDNGKVSAADLADRKFADGFNPVAGGGVDAGGLAAGRAVRDALLRNSTTFINDRTVAAARNAATENVSSPQFRNFLSTAAAIARQ